MSVNNIPPPFIKIVDENNSTTLEYRRFFDRLVFDLSKTTKKVDGLVVDNALLGQEVVPDSTAVTVADLVIDFNNLLAKLRTAGVIL
jgi:hypothetical protein